MIVASTMAPVRSVFMLRQVHLNRGEDLRGQGVTLQQATELQDRRFIRDVGEQVQVRELTKPERVVKRLVHRRVR